MSVGINVRGETEGTRIVMVSNAVRMDVQKWRTVWRTSFQLTGTGKTEYIRHP